MSFYQRGAEKRKTLQEMRLRQETYLGIDRTSPVSGKGHLENDKRMRREIANSNERRRMQSINAGFQSLKAVVPHHDGLKLSKAAILQHTADYITGLEQEKSRLISQNSQLKQMVRNLSHRSADGAGGGANASPPPKRKKRDTESSDEGISLSYDDPVVEDLKRELLDLRFQLERERRMRVMLEEQNRTLESQLYQAGSSDISPLYPPGKLRQIASQVQAQIKLEEEKQRLVEEQRRAEEEKARQTLPEKAVPKPVQQTPPAPTNNLVNSSVSRRNLQTIVEAIRHLEGDHDMTEKTEQTEQTDLKIKTENIPQTYHSSPLHLPREAEGYKSDTTSGRDSPMSTVAMDNTTAALDATVKDSSGSGRDSPIMSVTMATARLQVLRHRQLLCSENLPLPHGLVPSYLSRPGVIVEPKFC